MNPFFALFLFLALATLSLAATSSAKKKCSLSRSKQVKKDGGASRATGQSPQAAKKKPVQNGKKMLKKRPKKRVAATKGLKKTSASAGKNSQGVCVAQDDFSKFALNFPKVLVELISGYLEDSFSVVLERSWSAAHNKNRVAVDSERHYLIAKQGVQASSHGDGEQASIGSPELSRYEDFQSSHDGRYLLLTGMTHEQVSSDSSEKTARWLVQDTRTKSLKNVTLESGETSFVGNSFKLSANGKTLVSMRLSEDIWTASVYQIKEHGKAALASKKGDFDGYICAVSGNNNRIFMEYEEKEQLKIHDISGDGSKLVLEIDDAVIACVGSCALNNDGSKAAFIDNYRKLYTVDVDKEGGSVSVSQLTSIDIPDSVISYNLIYDAKDRLYVFTIGNLWFADPSKRERISLEEAEAPQGYEIQSSAISPNGNYIVLLFQSTKKNKAGERQFQMIVKRNTKDVLMRLCGCKS